MSLSLRRVLCHRTFSPGLQPHRLYFQHARTQPRPQVVRTLFPMPYNSLRKESTQVGEDHTGHISAQANEGILFFDNIFPSLKWALILPWSSDRNLEDLLWRFNNEKLSSLDPMNLVKRAIPEDIPMKVTEILPRLKEGGAFVKFSHPEGIKPEEIEQLVAGFLKEKPINPWFNPFRRVRTHLVRGAPWLEDLYRFPTQRLKVEFIPPTPGGEAAELSQEQLYSLFRPYGKLVEISSQPSDSKILPKFAFVDFSRLRHTVMAKNCMHGFVVSEEAGGGKAGTILRLSYVRRVKTHAIWDWIMNHPRIVIPIAAAFLATLAVAIFDPIRTFFIKAHVTHSWNFKDSRLYRWFRSQATDIFSFRRRGAEEASLGAIWDDRKQYIDQLQTWLMETADTFIVVQGPRGSGKKELVIDQALKGHKNVLYFDCKPVQEARGDAPTIQSCASQVGYRPVFSWMNSFSSLIDLAAQGTIGVKSGFSETLDSQIAKVLQTTAIALKQVGLENRSKKDKDANLSDDDYLEAHPEHQPIVVVDNFLHKSEESTVIYDKIADWAAGLTSANIAHVIFLTTDLAFSKSLGKALPDRVLRQISLGDITPEVAKRFVISHLDVEPDVDEDDSDSEKKLSRAQRRKDLAELDSCIDILGGRLTDLEFLARRLKTGQSPNKAVQEIIEQSASEILKLYLLAVDKGNDRKWSTEQAWYLIKSLAEGEQLRYAEVLLSNTFSSSQSSPVSAEGALEALSQAELITIKSANGRPESIKAGKPVYQAAFKKLLDDHVLKARMDLAVLTELSKVEAKNIDKYENELQILGSLPRQPREAATRVQYLLAKLSASQAKVEALDKEMGDLKKVLTTEY